MKKKNDVDLKHSINSWIDASFLILIFKLKFQKRFCEWNGIEA